MRKAYVLIIIGAILITGAIFVFRHQPDVQRPVDSLINKDSEESAPEPTSTPTLTPTPTPTSIPTSTPTAYEAMFKKYSPQSNPEATWLLELDLLSKGMYCYDLPMFDPEWRKRGKEILYSSSYKNTAANFSVSRKVYTEGDYAIIYFPEHKNSGPDFLYKDSAGWILDRTAVWDNIHYNYSNTAWFAYDGDYPYLRLLKKVYSLERMELDNGQWAYSITED